MSDGTERSPSPSTEPVISLRVLCLGNELLGDDALGLMVADLLRPFAPREVAIVSTPESGFDLLDYALNVHRLVVVDTVQTGSAAPGRIYQFRDCELPSVPGGSPHYVGLCEALDLARKLGLPVADEVIILAVEAEDCLTIGREMSQQVRSAIPVLVRMVQEIMSASVRA